MNQPTRLPDNLGLLVSAMSREAFYPEPPSSVEIRQTHISYAILAGEFVYKLKKPVHFAFMDCSRLEQRLHFCLEEVRLNSRLAPRVYLGVFAILRHGDSFELGPQVQAHHPDAVEYTVKMRRLPDDRMLDAMLHVGRVEIDDINAIAKRIAGFHASVGSTRGWDYGSAAPIWRGIVADVAESEPFIGLTLEQVQYHAIDQFCRGFIKSHWELLNQRAQLGKVREGHGDLRAEHVCLEAGEIEVIDCVEFSERLRYGDVASDLAFLAMDIERLGAPQHARELIDAYSVQTSDEELLSLLPLYKCYRASVRGKVESLRSREPEVGSAERQRSRQTARDYYALACRYARAATPALIVVCGLSGTGKSTVARLVRHLTGFEVITSDRVRKRLAQIGEHDRANADYGAGIYSAESTQQTYDKMIAEAGRSVAEGRGVIVDATFQSARQRARIVEIANNAQWPALFVECVADEAQVRRRLELRASKKGEVSDATVEIYDRQRREFEAIEELSPRNHLRLDTARDPDAMITEIEASLAHAR